MNLMHFRRIHFVILYMLALLLLFLVHQRYEQKVEQYQLNRSEELKIEFKAVLAGYNRLAEHVFRQEIDRPEIQKIMELATKAESRSALKELHDMLQWQLEPLYENLKKSHIRQFHFHLPDAVSFVRFHRPEKFGDSLSTVRHSIVQVNKTLKPVTGFEEGRVFNGFRNVFPIFYHEKLVGTVEISYSFDAIRKAAQEIYPATYHFMLSRDVIDKKVWENERSNYMPSDISGAFLYDGETFKKLGSNGEPLLLKERIKEINAALPDQVRSRLDAFEMVQYVSRIEGKDYLTTFLPIKNVKGEDVAYFIVYEEDPQFKEFRQEFNFQVVAIGITIILATLLMLLHIRHSERAQQIRDIRRIAHTDSLTQIGNRTYFQLALPQMIEKSRDRKAPLSLIFFDIDHFKLINDRFGHQVGDDVLVELARLVKSFIRTDDILVRWGGEEFVAILPNTGLDDALEVAEKLRSEIESHHFPLIEKITCSFGATQLRGDDDAELIMERVDTQLYKAKESGRNRIFAC